MKHALRAVLISADGELVNQECLKVGLPPIPWHPPQRRSLPPLTRRRMREVQLRASRLGLIVVGGNSNG
jgi:hypothetical protein